MALRNWEIAVYGLYLLKGAAQHVHTEDIALKCHDLAPDSFSWIKYPKLPDKDIARVSLVDARKEKVGLLVSGRAGKGKGQTQEAAKDRSQDGWQLTENGIRWIRDNEERLARELNQREPKVHRQEVLQRLSRVRENGVFRDFLPWHVALRDIVGSNQRKIILRDINQDREDTLTPPNIEKTDKEFRGQDEIHFRVLLAEIVADAVCQRILGRQIIAHETQVSASIIKR